MVVFGVIPFLIPYLSHQQEKEGAGEEMNPEVSLKGTTRIFLGGHSISGFGDSWNAAETWALQLSQTLLFPCLAAPSCLRTRSCPLERISKKYIKHINVYIHIYVYIYLVPCSVLLPPLPPIWYGSPRTPPPPRPETPSPRILAPTVPPPPRPPELAHRHPHPQDKPARNQP